ncbi:MAG: TRAM domain-containing protein [Planctomycetota bacterium]
MGEKTDPNDSSPAAPEGAEATPEEAETTTATVEQEEIESSIPRRVRSAVTSKNVADRVTIYVVRALFFLVAAGLGVQGVLTFGDEEGVFGGILVGCIVATALIVLEALFARSPIRTIAAITFGLFIGLILSAVFQHVVRMIIQAVAPPDLPVATAEALASYSNLLTTSIFCYFGVTLLLSTKENFKFVIPYVEFRKEVKSQLPLILDTSVFIDGRFQALLSTNALDQRLEVPRFVLDELQDLADSHDKSIRERGRRGMEILRDIEANHWVDIIEYPLEPGEEVDFGLLKLAALHEGKIVTTDHNLTKRAELQGVRVLNINDLATALKPILVPGEVLRVSLLRAGDEAGQAVGFLRDGTMVVVEQSKERIGQEVSVEVTSAIQTSAGRMVFGRLKQQQQRRGRR